MIEADLRNASPARRASFFEDPQIRNLLRLGARVRRVSDLAAVARRDRVGMWRRFKRRWGRSPSEMLTLFRVVWAAHLQHHGHSNAEIAQLLGFRDAHHYARRLGARLGLSKTVFNSLSYSDVVGGIAACLARRAPVSLLLRRAAALNRSA
jgi:transcriptional regulator GlxA family with amidase domain